MGKFNLLDSLIQENNGFLKSSDAVKAGISRPFLSVYVKDRGLERVAHGLYISQEAWEDHLYVIQHRYSQAVFSHETALYLLGLAEREPTQYSLTLTAGTNASRLTKQNIKVYKVKDELFNIGVIEVKSPVGNVLRTYNIERTICDLVRSRRNIEIQDLQGAIKGYVLLRDKNLPLLMRYAKKFSVDKIVHSYMEVLL